ncbi:MAG: enoyl-CoA hydratase/isomerase family protein [Alphaproteobacteria bacterium]|nr:enoyl-CoA hydratase/isomerase family protein [Alphaproteobacteria bacterium]
MNESAIRLLREGAIARLHINRPERRNAVTGEMMAEIERLARAFATDTHTRVVLVTAEGRDFSVGADLSEPRVPSGDGAPTLLARLRQAELGAAMMRALMEIPQPTIALMKGVATGAGACIASACDFRLASDTARAGYGEVKLGINLMWRALPLCTHLVGPARAKRMIMTGQLFPAPVLKEWGFVDEVVAEESLVASGEAWAAQYAALPPIAVQMIKRSVNAVSTALDAAIMHMDTDQWMLASQTEDFREGVTAFFEKRPPVFRGR